MNSIKTDLTGGGSFKAGHGESLPGTLSYSGRTVCELNILHETKHGPCHQCQSFLVTEVDSLQISAFGTE